MLFVSYVHAYLCIYRYISYMYVHVCIYICVCIHRKTQTHTYFIIYVYSRYLVHRCTCIHMYRIHKNKAQTGTITKKTCACAHRQQSQEQCEISLLMKWDAGEMKPEMCEPIRVTFGRAQPHIRSSDMRPKRRRLTGTHMATVPAACRLS